MQPRSPLCVASSAWARSVALLSISLMSSIVSKSSSFVLSASSLPPPTEPLTPHVFPRLSNIPTLSRSSQGWSSSTSSPRSLARSQKSVIVHLLDDVRLTPVHVKQAIAPPISKCLVVLGLRRPYLGTLLANEWITAVFNFEDERS